MKFNVAYCFDKSSTTEIRETIEVDIPAVTSKEAPIAFTHRHCWFPQTRVYRWFNGNLYMRKTKWSAKETGWETLTEFRRRLCDGCIPRSDVQDNSEAGRQYAIEKASCYLILNGREVWFKAGEPRYVVITFGLGGNHAETTLMIDNEYNSNIAGDRYFNVLQRSEAVKEAIRVALARGDTNSVASIKHSWKITVKIPEAVKCDPPREAGPGNPFLNALDAATTVKDPVAAGLLAVGLTAKECSK